MPLVEPALDPIPDRREEGRRVDDGDRVQGLGVVRGREAGGFLQVAAQTPHCAEGDVLEVDDRHCG